MDFCPSMFPDPGSETDGTPAGRTPQREEVHRVIPNGGPDVRSVTHPLPSSVSTTSYADLQSG